MSNPNSACIHCSAVLIKKKLHSLSSKLKRVNETVISAFLKILRICEIPGKTLRDVSDKYVCDNCWHKLSIFEQRFSGFMELKHNDSYIDSAMRTAAMTPTAGIPTSSTSSTSTQITPKRVKKFIPSTPLRKKMSNSFGTRRGKKLFLLSTV
jgi:hypothetical protein